jgi:hypothetical protein
MTQGVFSQVAALVITLMIQACTDCAGPGSAVKDNLQRPALNPKLMGVLARHCSQGQS